MIPNQSPENDSAHAGFLQPVPPPPPNQVAPGQPLENYLQQYIAGVVGMDGTMVRPRWQPEPANMPGWGTDWCAVGLSHVMQVGIYPAVIHHGLGNNGDGYDELQRHEEFDILCTFYGPNAHPYASNLLDNLGIWQNRAILRLEGMAYIEAKSPTYSPELIRDRWWNRFDVTLTFRRIVRRHYHVLNILEAFSKVITEPGYVTQSTSTQISGGPILPPPYEPPEISIP